MFNLTKMALKSLPDVVGVILISTALVLGVIEFVRFLSALMGGI